MDILFKILALIIMVSNLGFCVFAIIRLVQFKKQILESNKLAPTGGRPGISVLTCIKGISDSLSEGLSSLANQKYSGPIEIIIIIEDSRDPALEYSKKVLAQVPQGVEVKWITDFKPVGGNPRTAKMAHGFQFAKHDWIYWDAADTFIEPNHFEKMYTHTKGDPKKYTTAFPLHYGGESWGAHFENVTMSFEIPSFFFINEVMRRPNVYGGSLLFHKSLIELGGGFSSVLNFLTEEIPLIKLFTKVGAHCVMIPAFVYVRQVKETLRQFYERKVRWMLIAKLHHPQFYYPSMVYSFFWIPLFGLITGDAFYLELTLIYLLGKTLSNLIFHLILRLPLKQTMAVFVVAPVYEFILVAYTIHALFKRRILWANDKMLIMPDGQVVREY